MEFPGGSIEKNESPIKAAEREISEELGFDNLNLIQLGSCYIDPMRSEFKGYFFKSKCLNSIHLFTSVVECELEESYFFWMGLEKIRKYGNLLASSAIMGLYLI